MGMFDDVRCLYPTPWPDAKDAKWQSKSTPNQQLSLYEIREDGTLWHEEYDTRFEENPEAPLGLYAHRENPRWVSVPITGEIEITQDIGQSSSGSATVR